MQELWLILNINPEPWAVGPASAIRRGGKVIPTIGQNKQLHAFKESVREQVREKLNLTEDSEVLFTGKVELRIYFWRHRADYTTHQARTHRKHEADGTNMFKATEDALQDVLYKNDKDNSRGIWETVEQGEHAEPRIVICCKEYVAFDPDQFPSNVWAQIDGQPSIDFSGKF